MLKEGSNDLQAEETLRQLGLKDCANNRIGGAGTKFKGISGGEKRRVSIGVQLLTNPSKDREFIL